MGSALPSKIELYLPQLQAALRKAEDPRQFAAAVRDFMQSVWLGQREWDRLWKLLAFESEAADSRRRMRFTILDLASVYSLSPYVCIWSQTDGDLTISAVEITLNVATAEIAGDLCYADTFIGKANPVVLRAFDTTSGVLSASDLSLAIPANKSVYLSFDSSPDSSIKGAAFDWRYTYD
jgi:hypothetical protein